MTSTLSKPFANPSATLHDLGLVAAFMGETLGPVRENAPPVSERARYARWTFGARVGELIADLAIYAGRDAPEHSNGGKRLFLYSDHPDDIMSDLIAVTTMVADFQRHADLDDYPETVNKAAAIILEWVADSMAAMREAGVRYETKEEKTKAQEQQVEMSERIETAQAQRAARAELDSMAWEPPKEPRVDRILRQANSIFEARKDAS